MTRAVTRLARAITVVAVATGTVALPALPVLGAPPETSSVELGELEFAPPASGRVAALDTSWATADPVELDGAVLVGAILEGIDAERAEDLSLELRTRTDGAWSPWTEMPIGDDGPDDDTDEDAGARVTTEPFWVEGADRVQVRASGGALPKVRLTGVEIGGGSGLGYDPQARLGSSAFAATQRPDIVGRSSWDPKGDCAPREAPTYADDVRFAIVHHTAGSNSYSADAADDVVRSICLYHRNTRGWDDIGYNFLVDRYGRIYEGRAGGTTEPVRGAHTKGFNSGSTGISMMGDFRDVDPPAAMVDAMDRLLAWKLDIHHVDPNGTTREIAGSGTRWAPGTVVDLPTITTHGELNSTSCPGRVRTFASGSKRAGPRVVARDGGRIFGGLPATIEQPVLGPRPAWSMSFRPGGAWALEVRDAAGRLVRDHSGAGSATATWDLRDNQGREVAPGRYTVRTFHPSARPLETQVDVIGATTRVAGSSAADTAIASSRSLWNDARIAAGGWEQSDEIVIGGEDDITSALAAPVAASHNAPLLLSGPSGLSTATRAEVSRLRPRTAILVGDTSKVPAAVETQLRALGVSDVQRIVGDDLQHTAARAGRYVMDRHAPREAVVVLDPAGSASVMADAVTGAGYAASLELPLLLTGQSAMGRPAEWVLEQRAWDRVLVVGSGPIDASAMDQITRAARTKSSSTAIERVDGGSVTATSRAIADRLLVKRAGLRPGLHERDLGDAVYLLPASAPLFGIGALPVADLRGGSILLVDGSDLAASPASQAWLEANAGDLTFAVLAADGGRISSAVAARVDAILRSAGPHRAPAETWSRWRFGDVSRSSTHGPNVQRIAELGITKGCRTGAFCPDRRVEREELASFLARMLDLPPGDGTRFSDVKASNVHSDAIGAIADAGITRGYADGRFRPADPVTREQMASFLARALDLPSTSKHYFSDVSPSGTHTAAINALAAAGITNGNGAGRFGPNDYVTREQMASFLSRSVDWQAAHG